GIPVLEGRAFTDDDRPDGPCVVVFSQRLAEATFGAAPALGRRVHFPSPPGARLGSRAALPQARGDGPGAGDAAAEAAGADSEDTTCELVGVAADVRDVLDGSPGDLYFASAQ